MEYEFSVFWIKENLMSIIDCWKCFSFWTALVATGNIYVAATISFFSYIFEIIINKIQTFKID